MCGIIGYVGSREASPILVEGLRRLEYRGYDSAGVAILDNGILSTVKSVGKIARLADTLEKTPIGGTAGVAHTRWATHGIPSHENAHPHLDTEDKIAVVHNGIIENFYTLRKWLEGEGVVFRSESDTEVLAHLIRYFFSSTLEDAVQKALHKVEGTYGIAVISSSDPGKIVGARNGSPLVVGVGEGENFIASDVTALLEHTRQMIYMDDREMVVIDHDQVHITNLENVKIDRKPEEILWDVGDVEKGGYEHYMRKEIAEQPRTIRDAFSGRVIDE